MIVLGTTLGPRAHSVDHFDGEKKLAVSKASKLNPFEGFYIDPNPIDQILYSAKPGLTAESRSTVRVFTKCGCLVKQFDQHGELPDHQMHFLKTGVYYLKISNNSGTTYRKIIIN